MLSGLSIVISTCLIIVESGKIPDTLRDEIQAHKDDVDRIIDYVIKGKGRHQFYDKLAIYSDDLGPRYAGSAALEEAIDWTKAEMEYQGFDAVQVEPFTIDKWVRGEASAAILAPRPLRLDIAALGTSVGTPSGGITADVIVVATFDELENEGPNIQDKIVVYNQEWKGYGDTVPYRTEGATRAAKFGAKAVLVGSVTPHSIYSIHTGNQNYGPNVTKIPAACITKEDAQMLHRLFKRGGHIDTWDIAYGPMDDGGGVIMSWQVILNLMALDLTPKRTIRLVLWSAEEIGVIGGKEYFEQHKDNHQNISLVMESDAGTFKPNGIGFTGHDAARAVMEEILLLLSPINASGVGSSGIQADIEDWINYGVPGANIWNQENDYFSFHHSYGDSMTMEDPDVLDLCCAVWTAVTYVVANLEDKLPRTDFDDVTDSGSCAVYNICLLGSMYFLRYAI
ncbi:hypothetical protein LSH36_647g00020 [Paralvinella palmiformis]|uniref:Carboxypeptidase Q n=1 Tax=Paralvinella palmiformis TaxID=53620 RepID=A0AAD9MVR5_9ANNE|nr:hypothetical protein LSH36_647g00020 [Paralvinella palmiformis]